MRETPTISELKSLGPKSQQLLANVGITTVQQLEELGAVAAYLRAKGANPGVTLNLLWGAGVRADGDAVAGGGAHAT